MRFSLQYEQHKIPEWASVYIRYAFLHTVIKPLYGAASDDTATDSFAAAKIPLMTFLHSYTSRSSQVALASIHIQGEEDLFSESHPIDAWMQLLSQDFAKLTRFFENKFREYTSELGEIVEYVSRNMREIDALLLLSDDQDPRVRISSLQRAIQSCHRSFWNLEVFLEINVLALKRLSEKLKKVASVNEELLVVAAYEKQLQTHMRSIHQKRKQVYSFASEQITHKSISETKAFFRRAEIMYNPSDLRTVSFCHGLSLVSLSVSIYSISQLNLIETMAPSFCVFRLIACFVFALWVASGVLYVFSYYEINWLSVFEVQRRTVVSFIKLTMAASVWTAVLSVLFMAHTIFMSKKEAEGADVAALASFVIFLALWLLPLHILHLKLRKEIAIVLGNIFISPFGEVKFVHFFTADVLTSLAKPIADIYRCFCYFTSASWMNNSPGDCKDQLYYIYALSVVPYVWRFLQCWNRYYYTRQWFPHLVNVGKYSMGMLTVTVTYFETTLTHSESRALFVVVLLTATAYMLVWDTMMDFGFRRFFKKEGRKQKMYPDGMYYYVFFANILLRFTWVLTLMPKFLLVNAYLDVEILLLVVCLLEILRRGQWTLLRVENEKFSNIEKYRNDDFVPKMPKIVLDD